MIVLGRVYEVVKALACLRKRGHIEWVEKDEDLLNDLWWYQGERHGRHGGRRKGNGISSAP
jgi:hypothetical protein